SMARGSPGHRPAIDGNRRHAGEHGINAGIRVERYGHLCPGQHLLERRTRAHLRMRPDDNLVPPRLQMLRRQLAPACDVDIAHGLVARNLPHDHHRTVRPLTPRLHQSGEMFLPTAAVMKWPAERGTAIELAAE